MRSCLTLRPWESRRDRAMGSRRECLGARDHAADSGGQVVGALVADDLQRHADATRLSKTGSPGFRVQASVSASEIRRWPDRSRCRRCRPHGLAIDLDGLEGVAHAG